MVRGGQDPYDAVADRFVGHYERLRGAVRSRLVAEQLDGFLTADEPLRIVDVGGGAGHLAFRLAAMGHEVTLVDPSQAMLDHARGRLETFDRASRDRIEIVQATASGADRALDGRRFDVVCCHGVLPVVDDAPRLVRDVVGLAAGGAIVSLLFKNRDALAMRPGLEGRWDDALVAFDGHADIGGMGVATNAHGLDEITGLLSAAGAVREAWFGIRVFSDHLTGRPVDDRFEDILAVERRAARRDPYRRVARLIHLVARNGT